MKRKPAEVIDAADSQDLTKQSRSAWKGARKTLTRALTPTIPKVGTAFVAVLGLYLAWQANCLVLRQNSLVEKQNSLLESQNGLLAAQNSLLESQNILSDASRRAAVVAELTSVMDEVDAFLESQPKRPAKEEVTPPQGPEPIPADAPSPQIELPAHLASRIVASSLSLRPYRYTDDKGTVSTKALSPERGQLIMSLAGLPIKREAVFGHVTFAYADLHDLPLQWIDLRHAYLASACFAKSRLYGADFRSAQLD